jgi:hypothetical protein
MISTQILNAQPDSDVVPVIFRYSAKAERVNVAGSFNGWSDSTHPMQATDSGFVAKIALKPGYYYYKLVADGQWIHDPANPLKVNDGGTGWNSILKAGEPPVPKRTLRSERLDTSLLPRPVFPARPVVVALYYAAWKMAWQKIAAGNAQNGFAEAYMDEGFNEQIYQWDSCFMSAFGIYSNGIFPAMATLDNFYIKQRDDGYIQRVYFEDTGLAVAQPTAVEPLVNPPLFAWVEARYYLISGDQSRLNRVFPVLKKYFDWMNAHTKSSLSPDLYFNTELGSGMDNTPRPEVAGGAWIDASAQMALFSKMMRDLSVPAGYSSDKAFFDSHYQRISKAINKHLWSSASGFYHDADPQGRLNPVIHIGGFWPLIAGVADNSRKKKLFEKLTDSLHFNRPHRVPTLSASDPGYKKSGHYWLGGIWAPTNYMVIQGLQASGKFALAGDIARNHVDNIAELYTNGVINVDKIPFEQRFEDGYHTLWEAYAPETREPATRWDDTFYTRQDFVGWTGLGPISMVIEQLIGLEFNLAEGIVTWNLDGNDTVGLQNIQFKEWKMSLLAEPDATGWKLTVSTSKPLQLRVIMQGRTTRINVMPERRFYQVKRILE